MQIVSGPEFVSPHVPDAGLGTPFFSVQNVPFFSVLKRERYILFRSFPKFLATYETQKNVTFFSVYRRFI